MIVIALALQAAAAPITDWQPFPMQRSPNGGLFDRASASRKGEIVNAWVRLVNVRLQGVDETKQTDARMEFDCRTDRGRVVEYRIVRPDGSILETRRSSAGEASWRRMGSGMRGFDVRAALCSRVR